MIKVVIAGFGNRGQMFGRIIKGDNNATLVAIAEPDERNRKRAETDYNVCADRCYKNAEELFKQGKIADVAFICSQDAQHKEMAIKALELGYDILLEKPAAATIEDCLEIRDKANALNKKVMLTHVLRYTPFYRYIKHLIVTGKLGTIVNIEQTENVAYWHFAHSYVRGPWGNMKKSTPTIIAKCCHDLDLISWLMNKRCVKISSVGELFWFKEENAPKGSAGYCHDCPESVRNDCLYNAYKVYTETVEHAVVGGLARVRGFAVNEIIDKKEDPISKCVYRSDNDAIDNQIVNMVFEDGSLANLNMIAFSRECYRYTHVHGTLGDVYGNIEEGLLHVNIYGQGEKIVDVNNDPSINTDGISLNDGHGGGDHYLYKDFMNYITTNDESITRTTIDQSIESHVMGFKAEESRLHGGKPITLYEK